jgi:hypothetical protein
MNIFIQSIISEQIMKIDELRKKLAELPTKDLIKVSSEFYKLIPKAQKEEKKVDEFVLDPSLIGKRKKKDEISISMGQLEELVNDFVYNVNEGYYFRPNRIVSKPERRKWRYLVMNWYPELININRPDKNLKLQTQLLIDIFKILCKAEGYHILTSTSPFDAIKISKNDYFGSLLLVMQEAYGKADSLQMAISVIADVTDNYSIFRTNLADIFVESLTIPDLKYKSLVITRDIIIEWKNKLKITQKISGRWSIEAYNETKVINFLAITGFKLYASLYEFDKGIAFFKKHFEDSDKAQVLFELTLLLFKERQKDYIFDILENSLKENIKIRKSLVNLLDYIKENDKLPEDYQYF